MVFEKKNTLLQRAKYVNLHQLFSWLLHKSVFLLSDYIRLSPTGLFKTLRTLDLIPTEFLYIGKINDKNKQFYNFSKNYETN